MAVASQDYQHHHVATTHSISSNDVAASLPHAIQGLDEVIALLKLHPWTRAILAWCLESGAAFLDEIADCAQDVADTLGLKNEERDRLMKWSIEFSAASSLADSGCSGFAEDEELEETCVGSIKWASPLAQYIYIDIQNDEREHPLLESVPSQDQCDTDGIIHITPQNQHVAKTPDFVSPSISSNVVAATLPHAIHGLDEVIALLELQAWTSAIVEWCLKSGAAFIDEVADCAEDVADTLGLKTEERDRLIKWSIQFSAASSLAHSGGPGFAEDEKLEETRVGRIKWASPLAQYMPIDIQNDERERPLLEIVPSQDQCDTFGVIAVTPQSGYSDKPLCSRQKNSFSLDGYGLFAINQHFIECESDGDTDVDSDWDGFSEADESDLDIPLGMPTTAAVDSCVHVHHAHCHKLSWARVHEANGRQIDRHF